MANAAFTSLVTQASLSLINNQGNLGAVLKDLGSSNALKSLAVAVVTAGVTQGLVKDLGIDVSKTADFADRLAYQAVQSGVGVAANTTIGGVAFDDALKSGALSIVTAMASQTLFKSIGDLAGELEIDEGDIRKVIAHAVAGCAVGQITQNCVAGAIGAGLQELGGDVLQRLSDTDEEKIRLAGLTSAVAAMLVGGDASAVNAADGIAQSAATYNRQLHVAELKAIRDKAQALADADGDGVLSADEASKAREWETRLTSEALRTVDAYWNARLDDDAEAAQIIKEMAATNSGFDVTVGGRAVAFLRQDAFYDNRALYANFIRENADLYDKALAEWTPGSKDALKGKISPSSLAVIDSIGSSSWRNLSPEDLGKSDAENIAATGQTMADALADIRSAEREIRDAYDALSAELNAGGMSSEARESKESELKQLRSQLMVAAQASNMACIGFDQLLVSGTSKGVDRFVTETASQLADLAWDVTSSPFSEKSRQDLLNRADAIATLLGNPRLAVDYFQDAYAQADVLEKMGRINDAEEIRAKTTLELISVVYGGAGAVKAAIGTVPKIAELLKVVAKTVPEGWRPVSGVGAQVNTPRGFTSYATPDGQIVHVSPGGLQYGSDQKFGNRVDHVLDHTAPNPSKPVHSVFNVQGDAALDLVDQAWTNRTGSGMLQANGNRTWIVDFGRPVGTNGQTSVQIVVKDGTSEIVTAFPK